MRNKNMIEPKNQQCVQTSVRRSYLDKIKDDLAISKEKFEKCRKYSEKWKFYRDHIEWLESEIVSLS